MTPTTVIFDIGNVLVDWSVSTFLMRNGFSEEASARLATGPLSLNWHSRADLGLSIAENVRQQCARYSEDEEAVAALKLYARTWQDTVIGHFDAVTTLLPRLKMQGLSLYALTNFPADQFNEFCARHDFMTQFEDVVVSGQIGLKKPDPRIFALALDRFGCAPEETLFIDDRAENCAAAEASGIRAHCYRDAALLEGFLKLHGAL